MSQPGEMTQGSEHRSAHVPSVSHCSVRHCQKEMLLHGDKDLGSKLGFANLVAMEGLTSKMYNIFICLNGRKTKNE